MKASHPLTTTSIVALLACLGAIACSGAEVAQTEQTQRSGLTEETAAPAPEATRPERPERRHGAGPDGRRGPPSLDKMIERFDTNKNGTLEAAELPERMQQHIGDIDTSGDGVVTKEELEAHMKKRFSEHAKERFTRMDANKDGVLDESELGKRWDKLSAADQNGDKKLSADELRAAFESGKIAPMRGKPGHFGKFGKRGEHGKLGEHGKRGEHGKQEAPAAPTP